MNKSVAGYVDNLEMEAVTNANYRTVVFTGGHMQVVLMSLKPDEEIGSETHDMNDQFFRVEQGQLTATVGGEEHLLTAGMALIVPAGVRHNIVNHGQEIAKLYTVYAPAVHPAGTIQETKPPEEAE